jgi:uncharacterized protein
VLTVGAASLMHNLLVLGARGRRRPDVRGRDAALLIAAALPGIALGAIAVSHIRKPPLQLAVGVAIVLAVALRLDRPGRLGGRGGGVAVGLLSGALTTTVGINGPPLVLWLRAGGVTVTQLRDTLAVVFLTFNSIAIVALTARGGRIPAAAVPALAAGLVAGHLLGLEAHRRLSSRTLERAIVVVLTAAGVASIAAAVL